MRNCRLPPTFIPATPSSHPLMTSPLPEVKSKGCSASTELSNFLPWLAIRCSGRARGCLLGAVASADLDIPVLQAGGGLHAFAVTLVGALVLGCSGSGFFVVVCAVHEKRRQRQNNGNRNKYLRH